MDNTAKLTAGTRVRVAERGGATGTVEFTTVDRRGGQERPIAAIKFDGAGTGFNYPEQIEVIGQ